MINGLFLVNYGLKSVPTSTGGTTLTLGTDWRIIICWFVLYPLSWFAIATYVLPTKLTASPLDLGIGTMIVALVLYIQNGMAGFEWLIAFIYGFVLLYFGVAFSIVVPSLVGLGSTGDSYFYGSFLMKGKTVADVRRIYSDPLYINWLGFEPITESASSSEHFRTQQRFFSLRTPKGSKLVTYVFFTDHVDSVLVQIITFERGKYTIFRSKNSDYAGGQMERTILRDLESQPIPCVDDVEKSNAEFYALRVTRSVLSPQEISTHDKAILLGGFTLALVVALVAAYVPNLLSVDNAFTLIVLIALGVLAELSYKRIRMSASQLLRKRRS